MKKINELLNHIIQDTKLTNFELNSEINIKNFNLGVGVHIRCLYQNFLEIKLSCSKTFAEGTQIINTTIEELRKFLDNYYDAYQEENNANIINSIGLNKYKKIKEDDINFLKTTLEEHSQNLDIIVKLEKNNQDIEVLSIYKTFKIDNFNDPITEIIKINFSIIASPLNVIKVSFIHLLPTDDGKLTTCLLDYNLPMYEINDYPMIQNFMKKNKLLKQEVSEDKFLENISEITKSEDLKNIIQYINYQAKIPDKEVNNPKRKI